MAEVAFSIKWAGPPASYTPGRPRSIRYVVLHTTEGSEGPTSAEDGNAYDKRRTDGVSTHYFTDSSGAALCEVHDEDTAHAALYHGNAIGIQIEICGRAGQSAAQWDDAVSRATLETTAALVAHLCKVHSIPPVRLSVDQCRASWYAASDKRPKGIVDHYTVTRAYPEDGGTHTDVGPHFPWSDFLARVNEIMEGDVAFDETDKKALAATAERIEHLTATWDETVKTSWAADPNGTQPMNLVKKINEALAQGKKNAEALARIEAALSGGTPLPPAGEDVDVTGVLTLTPRPAQG